MYQKIFVPVDGSDPSNCGLLEAINLAKTQKARLKVLHIVDEHVMDEGYSIGTYEGNVAEVSREQGLRVLHNAAALVRQSGLEPETLTVESLGGNIAPMIVRQAKEWGADLIVMGTHGRRGLRRLALGSDAEEVVRLTRIPVLLIHDGSGNTPEAQLEK